VNKRIFFQHSKKKKQKKNSRLVGNSFSASIIKLAKIFTPSLLGAESTSSVELVGGHKEAGRKQYRRGVARSQRTKQVPLLITQCLI
jgi:hypothetical protein